MTKIKLIKRYPQSRTEDIVNAYMRGWNDALDAVQNGKFHIAERNETESECNTCKYAEDADEHCELCGIADINNYEPKADRKTENSSEKPNNCETCRHKNDGWYSEVCTSCSITYSNYEPQCEHITEDGVTCARYPACDDCPDNPLNKVKGSERLLKGKDEPTISKMEQVDEPTISKMEQVDEPTGYNLQPIDKDINVRSKDEPQTIRCPKCGRTDYIRDIEKDMGVRSEFKYKCINCNTYIKDEPQTERSE